MAVDFLEGGEPVGAIVLLEFVLEAEQKLGLLVGVGEFEEGHKSEGGGDLAAVRWLAAGGVGMGGARELEHGLQPVVLDGFALLSVEVHEWVEGGLVGDRTLGVVTIVLGQLSELLYSLPEVPRQLFSLLLETDFP